MIINKIEKYKKMGYKFNPKYWITSISKYGLKLVDLLNGKTVVKSDNVDEIISFAKKYNSDRFTWRHCK